MNREEGLPLLHDVSLQINAGEIVGISGFMKDEINLLCEIIGNMRPYYKGDVEVSRRGLNRKKREVVENQYYFDSTDMMFPSMTVLEQLMLSVNKNSTAPILDRQKKIMDLMVRHGFEDILLKKIMALQKGERIAVLLVQASMSTSGIIIANLSHYNLSHYECECVANAVKIVKQCGKTLIFGTLIPKLVGMCADKVAYLNKGTVEYYGLVSELNYRWDKVVCLIKYSDLDGLTALIESALPQYRCVREKDCLLVQNYSDEVWNVIKLYDVLRLNGIVPEYIKFNKGRVENSFNEIKSNHDI